MTAQPDQLAFRPVYVGRWLMVMVAVLAGCAQPAPATGAPVAAEIIEFAPDGYATGPLAALSDQPPQLRFFAGWWSKATHTGDPGTAPEPGRTYLAVADRTGCRRPTGVEVRRDGDDLRVVFTGGTDHPECARPYGPAAVLSVATADLTGVTTIDGRAPVAPDGPGTLAAFHPLGSTPFGEVAPAELGTDVSAMATALAEDPDAVALLSRPVPTGTRAFAFLLSGCRDTGAVLIVDHSHIDAEPTGGNGANCLVAEHYLAVLEVPSELVAPTATLG